VSTDALQRATVSLVAWHEGKLIATELDPTIAPAQSFVEEMLRPTARWRLVAYDEGGQSEPFFDTLLTEPLLLASDEGGVIVGDRGRAHMRASDGRWTTVQGVDWPVGLGTDALVSLTPTHATFAQRRRRRVDGQPHAIVARLDRRSGKVEALPDLEDVEAIGASEQFLAWAPSAASSYLEPRLMLRPLFSTEATMRIALPSRATRISCVGTDFVVVLDQGFGVVRDGVVRVLHPEHRFVQVWPAAGASWFALIGGAEISRGPHVERVGARLCRIQGDDLETLWVEVPPPLSEKFEIGASIGFAIGQSRLFFTPSRRIQALDLYTI
jgi:hypothetical protein